MVRRNVSLAHLSALLAPFRNRDPSFVYAMRDRMAHDATFALARDEYEPVERFQAFLRAAFVVAFVSGHPTPPFAESSRSWGAKVRTLGALRLREFNDAVGKRDADARRPITEPPPSAADGSGVRATPTESARTYDQRLATLTFEPIHYAWQDFQRVLVAAASIPPHEVAPARLIAQTLSIASRMKDALPELAQWAEAPGQLQQLVTDRTAFVEEVWISSEDDNDDDRSGKLVVVSFEHSA
jgi:hypothetical protein